MRATAMIAFLLAALVCTPSMSQQKAQAPSGTITITHVPPTGQGDPNRTHPITGTARATALASCRVVIFAHTDAWYVQPATDRPLTEIGDDGTWNTSTHPGDHYAAVLACGTYNPPAKADALPIKRAPVVAIDIKPKL